MSGDVTNVDIWTGADVFIAPLGVTAPTDVDTAWATVDADWAAVGLLDGSEGFTEARDEETEEHYAWGSILVRKTRSKHKRTVKFVAMEDNETVFGLVNPGSTRSTAGGLTTSTVKVPTTEEFAIGFEVVDGDVVKRRIVERATVEEVGEIKDSEEGPSVYEITVLIYPETDGTLYTEIKGSTA